MGADGFEIVPKWIEEVEKLAYAMGGTASNNSYTMPKGTVINMQFPTQQPTQIQFTPNYYGTVSGVTSGVTFNPDRPVAPVTKEHIKECLIKGGVAVVGAIGVLGTVLVGLPYLISRITGWGVPASVLIVAGLITFVVVSYEVGNKLVTKENKFYEDVLGRMAEPGKQAGTTTNLQGGRGGFGGFSWALRSK